MYRYGRRPVLRVWLLVRPSEVRCRCGVKTQDITREHLRNQVFRCYGPGKSLAGLLKSPHPPIQPLIVGCPQVLYAGRGQPATPAVAAGNLVPARAAVEHMDQRALCEDKVLGSGFGRFKADRGLPVARTRAGRCQLLT